MRHGPLLFTATLLLLRPAPTVAPGGGGPYPTDFRDCYIRSPGQEIQGADELDVIANVPDEATCFAHCAVDIDCAGASYEVRG